MQGTMCDVQHSRCKIGHRPCNMQHATYRCRCSMQHETAYDTAHRTTHCELTSLPATHTRTDGLTGPCRPCDRCHGILCRMGHRAPCVGDMPGGSVSLQHGLGPTGGELGARVRIRRGRCGEDRHVTDLLVLHRPCELLRPTQVLEPNVGRSCGAWRRRSGAVGFDCVVPCSTMMQQARCSGAASARSMRPRPAAPLLACMRRLARRRQSGTGSHHVALCCNVCRVATRLPCCNTFAVLQHVCYVATRWRSGSGRACDRTALIRT
jgi:hypothetical protein